MSVVDQVVHPFQVYSLIAFGRVTVCDTITIIHLRTLASLLCKPHLAVTPFPQPWSHFQAVNFVSVDPLFGMVHTHGIRYYILPCG